MKRGSVARLTAAVSRLLWLTALAWGCAFSFGCAAFHPIQGVPARYLPEEFRGTSRAGKRTIDLSLLKQTPPAHYLLDSGDTLAVYIEGVLGDRRQPPPQQVALPAETDVAPSFGFPIPVRDDGTISLPLVGSIFVRGKSISEVEALVKQAYTVDRQFLNPDNDRILVSLQKPRQYRVLVLRQEMTTEQNFAVVGRLNFGAHETRHGEGRHTAGLQERRAARPRGNRRAAGTRRRKRRLHHPPAQDGGRLDASAPKPRMLTPPDGEAKRTSTKRTIIRAQAPREDSPRTPPPNPTAEPAYPLFGPLPAESPLKNSSSATPSVQLTAAAQADAADPASPQPADVINAQFSPPPARLRTRMPRRASLPRSRPCPRRRRVR